MAINITVQYSGGLLSDIIILLTRGYYHRGTGLITMQWLCLSSLLCNSILLLPCLMYYIVFVLFLLFVWCPCMAINVMLLLFLTFSVLVANPKKLLYTVANPARGLLNREKRTKEKVWQHTPHPPPPTLLVRRK